VNLSLLWSNWISVTLRDDSFLIALVMGLIEKCVSVSYTGCLCAMVVAFLCRNKKDTPKDVPYPNFFTLAV